MNSENWTQFLSNPMYVQRIYSNAPNLNSIDIQEVALEARAVKLKLRFAVADFPDKPPEKWVRNQWNHAQFTLHLSEISDVQITAWSNLVMGPLLISKNETGIWMKFSNGKQSVECCGKFLDLEIEGYHVPESSVSAPCSPR